VFHDATVGIVEFQTLDLNIESKIDKLYNVDIKTLADELSKDNKINNKSKKFGLNR
jgi:hypothetical protein